MQDLYEGNRRLHVEIIGHGGRADGLYKSFRDVVTEIDRVQERLQAGRDPWWYWVGHIVAAGLTVLFVLSG